MTLMLSLISHALQGPMLMCQNIVPVISQEDEKTSRWVRGIDENESTSVAEWGLYVHERVSRAYRTIPEGKPVQLQHKEVVELYRRLDNGSSSKPAHILGGCIIGPRCESRRSSMVASGRQSQHMDRAADSLGLLLSHSGAQYESYLKCEAEQESAAMPSFSLCSEEAVGYKAITWSCRVAWIFLDNRGVVRCLYAAVPPGPSSIDQSPNGV
ncbi:predicted protein [Postia placenta Mad-698-R]|uniref:Uncharacterized protein n=1 Tax=Postia placenta MAD-698-R-SB12 TaxID=670580 RepID=A0A1X6MKA6_9APHY|nr:hypothetical protein POSPLADRAFT_1158631 [Postia placenta MAD-698-R-SB12]EED83987.1 predicted protein [Postia placenta Mad-698-R]OSX56800.1 hypothetical protein POSPLADRAFT_1158631 [Postia placenta MAD-698-R-SB12]